MSKPVKKLTIAATDAVFGRLFDKTARVVELRNDAAQEAYVQADDTLTRAIESIGGRLFKPAFVKKNIYVLWDWWPNRTRYVEVSIDAFTQRYFDALRALLTGKFKHWRIQAVISADILDGKTTVGSICIWSERLLVDRALYAILTWRRIKLRCETEPVSREK